MCEQSSSGLATIARWLHPVANRLVFYGIETCRHILGSEPGRVRGDGLAAGNPGVIATVPLGRLAPEIGFHIRTRERHTLGESWVFPDATRITVTAAVHAADATDAVLLEYATLLTQHVTVSNGQQVRVVSLPVQLALLWRAHLRSGHTFVTSTYIEDVVELAARRSSIAADVAALPGELRGIVAHDIAKFCASDAASWVVARAIHDARDLAGVVTHVMAQLEAVAMSATA